MTRRIIIAALAALALTACTTTPESQYWARVAAGMAEVVLTTR